ncbi:MAG: riboflavin synthase, partial [Kiritimatiellia bacterium]
MFTGLIQKVGRHERLSRTASGATLTVRHDPWPSPLVPGESIAVNGVCLTVKHACSDRFECDILEETLARSNLGSKAPGALLNLE